MRVKILRDKTSLHANGLGGEECGASYDLEPNPSGSTPGVMT